MPDVARPDTVVVCLPDIPDRVHMGVFPANVDVRLVPPEPEPVPDLAEVELIVPFARTREPLLELLARGGGGWAPPAPDKRQGLLKPSIHE